VSAALCTGFVPGDPRVSTSASIRLRGAWDSDGRSPWSFCPAVPPRTSPYQCSRCLSDARRRARLVPDTAVARAISSTWRSPIMPRAGGNVPAMASVYSGRPLLASLPRTTLPGLPPARGVIALREVVGMARPLLPSSNRHRPARPAISETCPSGEDAVMPVQVERLGSRVTAHSCLRARTLNG